ncbi:MAG: hypothetical protein M3O62_10545 [Pseudomonadota bacterium]|nr:hypothetical protein [Pseudomonadota bacterium]
MRTRRTINLATLSSPESFQDIWRKANWQGDDLELQRDHNVMQKLLQLTLTASSVTDVRLALDLLIELFKVHTNIECRLLGSQIPAHSIDYTLTLIEQLDDTDEDNPLYTVRAGNVLQQLALLMAIEEDRYEELDHAFTINDLDDQLLQTRERLLQDADTLIKAPELARAVTSRPS